MEDKKPQPSFYANIPATVRYDKKLCANAKLLYGEITALTNKNGYAWAGNEYFADLYDVSLKTVSRWISQLESEGYIKRVMVYKENSKEIKQRLIYLTQNGGIENFDTCMDKNENTYGQKCPDGGDKKAEDNNTLINNTLINIKPSRSKYEICDMENAELLFKMMQDNNPSVKKPNLEKWANEFRLIRERDERKDSHIKYMINWSQNDSFWKSNILSPSKLRKQWDQLVLKAKEQHERSGTQQYGQPTKTFRFTELAQEQDNRWGIE